MAEKEYIEREALVERLKKEECDCEWLWTILDIPAADVAPVKHGHWVNHKHTEAVICSECKRVFIDETNYCPFCGASMTNSR